MGFSLVCAHLDHNLRPDSGSEAEAALAFARSMDVKCFKASSIVEIFARKKKMGLEEAGRIVRYSYLYGLLKKEGLDVLVTAHQLNDLAEDMILRLIRGTSWPALGGMEALIPGRRLLRPLLMTKRVDLEHFLLSLGVGWLEDFSNLDETWRRNRIRHSILPKFMEENPNFLDSAAALWRQSVIDRDYWEEMIDLAEVNKPLLSREKLLAGHILNESHQALRLRWYKKTLDSLGTGQTLASTIHKLDTAWVGEKMGRVFQFPGNKRAKITPRGIVFYREEEGAHEPA